MAKGAKKAADFEAVSGISGQPVRGKRAGGGTFGAGVGECKRRATRLFQSGYVANQYYEVGNVYNKNFEIVDAATMHCERECFNQAVCCRVF
jgi:hypothetical protein